ncbi:MAG: ABC transporter substrate-binding protein [Anaerolineales bacterium]|jgi:arabinosaccharide transport system substrate-binding protein
MKPKKFSSLLIILGVVLSLLVGCAAPQANVEEPVVNAPAEAAPAAQAAATGEVTELQMLSFIAQHLTFFEKMAVIWNEEHPDEQIKIVPTHLEWDAMHQTLLTELHAGEGVPDIADVEIGRWPAFMTGEVQFLDLTDYVAPYKDEIVTNRLDIYSQAGRVYGVPSHIGATVMYYNTGLLEPAGVDFTDIVTWDDFENALRTYKENTGNYMTYCETYGAYQFTILLGELGKDLIDDGGMPQLNTPEALKAIERIRGWADEDLCAFIPGGNADTPEGRAAVWNGDVAALAYPLWYMSRFTDEGQNLTGQIAIAPLPVWDESSYKSMGLGGTGTTVYRNSPHADLAARFVTWAKLSELGSTNLWIDLGFDPVNKLVSQNLEVTKDPGNKFLSYFQTNPFDVLAQVQDKMFTIKTMQNSACINDYLSATPWNRILVDLEDPATVMEETQSELMSQCATPQD